MEYDYKLLNTIKYLYNIKIRKKKTTTNNYRYIALWKYLSKFLITKVYIKHCNNNFQFGWFWKALIIIDHILVVGNRPTWPQYKNKFDSLKSKNL